MKNQLVSGHFAMLWPLVIVLIGFVLYWTCTPNPAKPKLARLGEMTFFAGAIATAFALINFVLNV